MFVPIRNEFAVKIIDIEFTKEENSFSFHTFYI